MQFVVIRISFGHVIQKNNNKNKGLWCIFYVINNSWIFSMKRLRIIHYFEQ